MNWHSELLQHCICNVPRYAGLSRNICSFPIVDKRDMVGDIGSWISGNFGVNRHALASFLHDSSRERDKTGKSEINWTDKIVVEETSGTSGTPFNFPKLVEERARVACAIWRQRKMYDPGVTVRTFYAFSHAPATMVHSYNPFDCSRDNITLLYADLAAKGYTWIHGSPGLLLKHANALSLNEVNESSIECIECSGAFLSNEMKTRIQQQIGARVINQLGCREVWAIGYSGEDNYFDILTENVIVELVDDDSSPILVACMAGHIVVTARYQRLFPFVRYRTGDRAMWVEGGIGLRMTLCEEKNIEYGNLLGSGMHGSEYFRMMLMRAFRITGFIKIEYIQIIQIEGNSFILACDNALAINRLRNALEEVCNAKSAAERVFFVTRTVVANKSRTYPLFVSMRGCNKL